MDKAWKNLDLEGQGLQSANLRLVRLLKKRKVAYMWLLLFPTGMHRAYLADAHGAWIYRVISVLTAVSFILGYFIPGLVLLLPFSLRIYHLLARKSLIFCLHHSLLHLFLS